MDSKMQQEKSKCIKLEKDLKKLKNLQDEPKEIGGHATGTGKNQTGKARHPKILNSVVAHPGNREQQRADNANTEANAEHSARKTQRTTNYHRNNRNKSWRRKGAN
jgi:hypothetical protein